MSNKIICIYCRTEFEDRQSFENHMLLFHQDKVKLINAFYRRMAGEREEEKWEKDIVRQFCKSGIPVIQDLVVIT